MGAGEMLEYPSSDLPAPERLVRESPPEWWDDYPYEPQEPDLGFTDSHWSASEIIDQQINRPIVGPNCTPVPISSIPELHYIAPMSNLASILKLGILSHNQAVTIPHLSVADAEVNQRRANRRLLLGRVVHDYANLYVNARNPMLYRLQKEQREPLCIVRIASRVIRLKGALVSDGNVANDATEGIFSLVEDTIMLDRSRVFLRYWSDAENPAQERENKRCTMAEVLVPDIVSPHFIEGIYVGSKLAVSQFALLIDPSKITVNEQLFFGH